MTNNIDFIKTFINIDKSINLFDELSKSVKFENITLGRKGCIVVDIKETDKHKEIPIVRTTTNYKSPPQKMTEIYYDIIDNINKILDDKYVFNNIMIELYNDKYRKMKFHSDQSLDLDDNSYICILSCYNYHDIDEKYMRKLIIKNKETNEESKIVLENNSIILFSTKTNKKYLHKIVLENNKDSIKEILWLGVTFRLSKTFIKFDNDTSLPYFVHNNKELKLASIEQIKEFMKYKSLENNTLDFIYDYESIDYTISESDMIKI